MRRLGPPLLAGAVLLLLGTAGAQDGKPEAKPEAKPAAPARTVPGDATIRPSIESGLVWLCRHQDPDGGWHAKTVGTRCDAGADCAKAIRTAAEAENEMSAAYDPGITGLAILALLGSGTTPAAPVVVHGVKAEVSFDTWDAARRGVAWLLSQQTKDGTFAGPGIMYNECLGAIALAEAYRVNKDPDCRSGARRAVEFIEAGQADNPVGKGLWGWRYVPKAKDADTSVTGWVLRALESADHAGIHVPKATLTGAQSFIVWATGRNGLVGYLDPEGAGEKVTGHNDHFDYHVGTMSALGIQVRLRVDPTPDKPTQEWIKTAVNSVLLKDVPTAKSALAVDYYYWHAAMEAWSLIAARGPKPLAPTGVAWRMALVEALLSLQTAPTEKCSSGSWLKGDRWAYAGGPVYTTAINVLTLEAAAGG